MSWNEFAFFSLTLYSKQGPFLCPSAIPLPYCSSLFFLRSLCNILLEFFYLLSHNLRDGRLILDRIVVHPYPAHLNNAYHAEKEVYSGQEIVLGFDDKTPPCPNQTGGCQGGVLCERQLLGRTGKVGDARENQRPFHDRGPEMHSFNADRTIPHALEPRYLLSRMCIAIETILTCSVAPVRKSLVEGTGRKGTEEWARGSPSSHRRAPKKGDECS